VTDAEAGFLAFGGLVALVLTGLGLLASFFHLGRPERAWRAATQWRTSWLSREVIVLPAFMAVVALWWLVLGRGPVPAALPLAAVLGAAVLWVCTAMIYACLRFIAEWAQPLTVVNFALIGLSSGLLLGCALAAAAGQAALLAAAAVPALVLTALAGAARLLSLWRNARLVPRSTLQSATGIAHPQLVQKSMGMSAGAFNTREFFHGRSGALLRRVRFIALACGFAGPALLAALGLATAATWPWLLAVLLQAPGLLAERWLFFAQARHPQNLYYQTVS